MTTKFIGVKEFRQNISSYVKGASNIRYVVMNHKKPLFEVRPFEADAELESIFESILRAKEDVRKGRLHTQAEVLKALS